MITRLDCKVKWMFGKASLSFCDAIFICELLISGRILGTNPPSGDHLHIRIITSCSAAMPKQSSISMKYLPTPQANVVPSAQALKHIITFATTTWDLILETKLEVSLALVFKFD